VKDKEIDLYRIVWSKVGLDLRDERTVIRDDRTVDFHYPILSCLWKTISVSDPNPVLIEIILSVSENYPKMYCDAQHTFLCCVYFASWG